MKLPAFQFYPGDWRKDPSLQSLDYHERGVWIEMLCLMHESEERGVLVINGRAATDDQVARLLGLDKQTATTTLTSLLNAGVAKRRQSDGALYSKRMVGDQKLREIRAECGKKGGNPRLLKQTPTTGVIQTDNQTPTPSSSSSSSESKNLINSPKGSIPRKLKSSEIAFPPNLDTQPVKTAVAEWLEYKQLRKETYKSADSVSRLLAHWVQFGANAFVAAVDLSMRNNYAGLIDPKTRDAPQVSKVQVGLSLLDNFDATYGGGR